MPERIPLSLAVLSQALPPTMSGTALRIQRFFRDYDPNDYVLIASNDLAEDSPDQESWRLGAQYVRLPSEWRRLSVPRWSWLSAPFQLGNIILRVIQRTRNLVRILGNGHWQCLMVFTGDLENVIAAGWASRRLKLPLLYAVDDDFVDQWKSPVPRLCARLMEPWIVKRAAAVFAISDYCADCYRQKYECEPIVLYNPTDHPVGRPPQDVPVRHAPTAAHVVFAGSVYHANAAAIRLLIESLDLLECTPVELHIYTSQSREELASMHIAGGGVRIHPPCVPSDVADLLENSDILFLPMNLDSATHKFLRTSFPFKVSDYLVSGRAVLAIGPSDSFLCHYFRENHCGVVVDSPDVNVLAHEVRKLLNDGDHRLRIVRNAFASAARDFDICRQKGIFHSTLDRVEHDCAKGKR